MVSLTVGEDPPKDRCTETETETDTELLRGESADAGPETNGAEKSVPGWLRSFFFAMEQNLDLSIWRPQLFLS